MSADELPPESRALGQALASWFEELEREERLESPDPPWRLESVAPVFGQDTGERLPLVDARSVAAAVLDASGRLLAQTEAFTRQGGLASIAPDLLHAVTASTQAAYVSQGAFGAASPRLVAYAPARLTATWRLPAALHAAAHAHPGAFVLLTSPFDHLSQPLFDACWAFGLSGLQKRVTLQTMRTGGVRAAAAELGISYQTAREALADAMKRVGARRAAELVTRIATLAFGVFPVQGGSAALLADIWGLSERQIAIAAVIAEGASRDQAARLFGVSVALVKKELDAVYSLLGVNSGPALARKIVEVRAFGLLTAASAGGVGFVEDQSEPLRFALRPDGGRIAFSDYGPASGRPVLVLHSSMTSRIVSRKLLRALHRQGYRPISIDRPGFGLTDPLPAEAATDDPFTDAVADVGRVLAHLKIAETDIVSRGAAQFLVALARAMPRAIGRVVLVNPGPPYRHGGRSIGPLGVIRDAFVRNPATIRVAAPFLAGHLTYRRIARMMAQWLRGSRPDELAVRDPEIVGDFFRSVRMFATGRYEGFLREQAAIARMGRPPPFDGAAGWRVLLGDSDVLYDPEVVFEYWRDLLPGAALQKIPNAGRFLAMTHADLVVAALKTRPGG